MRSSYPQSVVRIRVVATASFLLLSMAIGFGMIWRPIHAQVQPGEELRWSQPQRIPGYSDTVRTPYLISDSTGTVHALVSEWVGEDGSDSVLAVTYRRWSPQEGWTPSIDVLLSPAGQARAQGGFLDAQGMLHAIFWGGVDFDAAIYYSRAHALYADRAQAWSEPLAIGPGAVAPDNATIFGNEMGQLAVVYSGNLDGISNNLYIVFSSDNGENWTAPQPIFITYSRELWPSALNVFVEADKRAHLTWGVANRTGNSEAVYYLQIDLETQTWTEPFQLAQAIGYEADTPSVIVYDDEILVVYHNDRPTTRWMRRSADGGLTWTEPVRLFPHVGSNGPASFAVDSGGTLHMFFGGRVGDPAVHGMWHTVWRQGNWSPPQPIVSGPLRAGFDPSFARAVVVRGNLIFVAWMTDPGNERRGTWFTYASVDSPASPYRPLPTPVPGPTPPSPEIRPTREPAPAASPSVPSLPPRGVLPAAGRTRYLNLLPLLGLSVVPSVLLLIALFGLRWLRSGRRWKR